MFRDFKKYATGLYLLFSHFTNKTPSIIESNVLTFILIFFYLSLVLLTFVCRLLKWPSYKCKIFDKLKLPVVIGKSQKLLNPIESQLV